MKWTFWSIPELWPGSTVFILGGGPSLGNMDLSGLRDHRVIGVNQAYKFGTLVDLLWYGDKKWYPSQLPAVLDYHGLIFTCSHVQPSKRMKRIKYIGRGKREGIASSDRSKIAWNGNSGASAVNVAYWLGAKRVILLGFDCKFIKMTDDEIDSGVDLLHWHDDYGPKLEGNTRRQLNPYPRFLKCWTAIAEDAERLGLEILNATPDSAIKCFPYIPLEELI